MVADLHPAPADAGPVDHRDAPNREQLRWPSESLAIWRRVVEQLAAELQIDPIDAHFILAGAAGEMTVGRAWDLWS